MSLYENMSASSGKPPTVGGYPVMQDEGIATSGQPNDWRVGPGQIPPGQPGANPQLLPGETEDEYIYRVVVPQYPDTPIEDVPGVWDWQQGHAPWLDPNVPWPSNVPRSPTYPGKEDAISNFGIGFPFPDQQSPQ